MKRSKRTDLVSILQAAALRYPEVETGTTCDKTSFKARNKAFLFLGCEAETCTVMLKLGGRLQEAAALAAREPQCYRVGGHGWVTATFAKGKIPPAGLLEAWIGESYRLLAPKQLVKLLSEGSVQGPNKKAAKKAARRK